MPTIGPVLRSLQAVTAYTPTLSDAPNSRVWNLQAEPIHSCRHFVQCLLLGQYGGSCPVAPFRSARWAALQSAHSSHRTHLQVYYPDGITTPQRGAVIPPKNVPTISWRVAEAEAIASPSAEGRLLLQQKPFKAESPEHGHVIKYGFPGPPRGPEAGDEPRPSNT